MRDSNSILSKINPIVTFFVVLALVLGATFFTLQWVESRKTSPAVPVAEAPQAPAAPAAEQKQPEQPAASTPTEEHHAEAPATQPEVAATEPAPAPESSPASAPAVAKALPDTGSSVAGIISFVLGSSVTLYLLLTLRRQKLALQPQQR